MRRSALIGVTLVAAALLLVPAAPAVSLAGEAPRVGGVERLDAAAGPAGPAVTDLGPASSVTSTNAAEQIGSEIWTATSGVSPVRIGAFDVGTRQVERTIDLPSGTGVWAMAHIGTDLYVGTYEPGDLYRIDTLTGGLTKVASFGSFIWSLAASPDGTIVAGTYPDAGVHSYNPATGETRSYGTVAPGEMYVRSIAVDEHTIYAGIGSRAQLITVDRESGETANVLPAEFADRTFVATLALEGNQLAAGFSPTGTMVVFDTDDFRAAPRVVQPPTGDQYVTAISHDPASDDIFFGTRASGTLYRVAGGSSVPEPMGQPYEGAYFNRILFDGGQLRASLTSQIVTYDRATGKFSGVDLGQAGLPPAPELANQIAATNESVLVSGKAGIQVHDLAAGTSSRPFLPGAAKTMTPVGDEVYLGVYTLARLWSMKPDGANLRELAQIENEQTRPTDAWYDEESGRLLISTEADYGKLEGALATYDVAAEELTVNRGVVPRQSIQSVAVEGGIAYLGSATRNSLGTTPIEVEATVSRVDLATGNVLDQIVPVPGAQLVTDLMPYEGHIYGTTETGDLFVLDAGGREVITTTKIGDGAATLVRARGGLYGTDGTRIFKVKGTDEVEVTTVLDGLAAQTFTVGLIAASPDGNTLYTIKERNLIAVTLKEDDPVAPEPTPTPEPTPSSEPTAGPGPSAAPTSEPAVEPTLSLGAATVVAGGSLMISGTGFAPNAGAGIELHSTPVTLAAIKTGAGGELRATVTIPTDTAPGRHTIVVEDAQGTRASAAISIGAAVLPATGAAAVTPWMIAAALTLLLAGGVLILATRLRRRRV